MEFECLPTSIIQDKKKKERKILKVRVDEKKSSKMKSWDSNEE